MPSILLTAFEPYASYSTNASQLALNELSRNLSGSSQVTMRVLPVDFALVKDRLADELAANYDYALHVGQAPGSAAIRLEKIALNVACESDTRGDWPLCHDGPLAYRTSLPLHEWAESIRAAGVPAEVSYHAGTYLCNAALYLTHYLTEHLQLKTRSAFIHLPLDPSQLRPGDPPAASLPAATAARAVRIVLEQLT